ncbi:MAG TPA: helix-turn-helix transcriptional regulator [Methylophilus sp.]|uniref:helix-turn-helix domain-containing protein n=1 Tax=Methylophilus sp. TaxID=29541 RepID=UPI002B5D79C2|nr:helix-turn-helix transcriptional regulator [Methylophilus sp.]HSH85766.1 helix-turn-helix transcriptional regulator [Methylophilus sp.]
MSPIAKRLKSARLEAGLSQEKLGVLAGIDELSSSARMNQYEKGVHTPPIELVRRFATVLNIPTEYFYTECEDMAKIVVLVSKMNVQQRAEVIAYLEKI